MKKKWFALICLVLCVIGVVLLIKGIPTLYKADSINVPSMGSEGWFFARSEQSHLKFVGSGLVTGGVMLIFMGIVLSIIIYRTIDEITRYHESQNSKDEESCDTSLSRFRFVRCPYCGSQCSIISNQCEHCGADINTHEHRA